MEENGSADAQHIDDEEDGITAHTTAEEAKQSDLDSTKTLKLAVATPLKVQLDENSENEKPAILSSAAGFFKLSILCAISRTFKIS